MNELERTAKVRQAEDWVASAGNDVAAAESLGVMWHHSIALADGTVVNGAKTRDVLAKEFELTFGPIDLSGLSVLDVGAWNGAFTFEAERRGAGSVVAVDRYTWFLEPFRGLETFLFSRRNLDSKAQYLALDIDETTSSRVGTFDVVLFLGVFYHLENPLNCLAELSKITKKWLIIETQTDGNENPLPAMRYYPGAELNGDPTNWWCPNPPCMVGLLLNAGFTEVLVKENPEALGRYYFHARKG